ncbi:MAG: carbon-nitrogen hydrolase family protein [Candidatus Brocadiae bacterium]|nr:carbon-nitrogen hydrolase family protein [Candidatus Brocadiia bacterium]
MAQRRDGPRVAVVGTCTLSPYKVSDPDQLLADGLAMVDEMARRAEEKGWSLDLVALPETFSRVERRPGDEALDGRTVTAMAEKARAYHTYAAVPVRLRQGEKVYNSVVMLDREGGVVGMYHKVFPVAGPDGSLEGGVTPGDRFPVFDLDFGRVGAQICFDVFFEDGWQALDYQDAELVVFASATPAVMALRSHAYRHQYYIVSSIHEVPSVVVDPIGREVTRTSADREPIVARFDLDYRVVRWSSLQDYGKALAEKYGDRVSQDWHYEEHMCLLTSLDVDLPVREVMQREKLGTHRQDRDSNVPAQMAARGGPPAQPPTVNHE